MKIPQKDFEKYITEQKKKGNIFVPMGNNVETIGRTINVQMDYKDCILRQIDQTRWSLFYGEEPFAKNAIMLVMMIPEQDQDDKFREDLEKSKYETLIDTGKRTYRAGGPSIIFKKSWVPDYFAIFQACINLFRRRGMLWSEQQVEVMK